jgi:hypothetical protein
MVVPPGVPGEDHRRGHADQRDDQDDPARGYEELGRQQRQGDDQQQHGQIIRIFHVSAGVALSG